MKWFSILLFLTLYNQAQAQHVTKHNKLTPLKDIKGLYQFKGKLNGKYPFSLWFVADGQALRGEVTYLNTAAKTPITVVGEIVLVDDFDPKHGDKIRSYLGAKIYEFDNKGFITRIFTLRFKETHFEVAWSKPGSERESPYTLLRSVLLLKHRNISLKPTRVEGEYLYCFGENGRQGRIDIKETDSSNYVVAINWATAGPYHNMAEVQPFKAKMTGNQIVYQVPGSNCIFQIDVFNDFVMIDYISNECELAAGAITIDRVFIKTSDKAQISH